jgi:predicted phosphodiesterase
MRIAILSDVHGNLSALEAVLFDIKQQNPDMVLFAGDLCVFGARPAECIQRLRSEGIRCLIDETDRWISNQPLLSDDIEAEEAKRSEHITTTAEWTWAQLNEKDRAWLRTLPYHIRFSPTENPKDDLYIVHANPEDVEQPIYPPESLQEFYYRDVLQTDDALEPLVGGIIAGVIAFGHLHIPSIRKWRHLTLVNISSVSLPIDGDVRAKYGLLTWDNGWTIEHRRVEYDIDQEVDYLSQQKMPQCQQLSQWLQTASSQN